MRMYGTYSFNIHTFTYIRKYKKKSQRGITLFVSIKERHTQATKNIQKSTLATTKEQVHSKNRFAYSI